MTATFAALPLTGEQRDRLPSLVARCCDLEARLHTEKGWAPFTPMLLIRGYRPDYAVSFPISPRDKDLVAFLARFAKTIRDAPPPEPAEAVVLVVILQLQRPDDTIVKVRLLVGVLGNGDLFTVSRVADDDPLLTWAPEPEEVMDAAKPFIKHLSDLINACATRT